LCLGFDSEAAETHGIDVQWHEFPNGYMYHIDCIHQFDDEFHVDHMPTGHARVSFAGSNLDKEMVLPPCPHAPRKASTLSSVGTESTDVDRAKYYSDWVAYAQTTKEDGFGSMASTWNVPAKPTSQGPFPPLIASSIYLFNGLENSGGHAGTADVILQPVLQYGKSGCLLNPLKFGDWYFTSYQVGVNGRAYCGSNIGPLKEGEDVVGTMTLTDVASNTWKVDSLRVSTGAKSTHTVALGNRTMDAAYATLEGMVIYNCKAFPASGSTTFSNNTLTDKSGRVVSGPAWKKMIGHSECDQDVKLSAGAQSDDIEIKWNAKKEDAATALLV
jgi:hypothetical protein